MNYNLWVFFFSLFNLMQLDPVLHRCIYLVWEGGYFPTWVITELHKFPCVTQWVVVTYFIDSNVHVGLKQLISP